MFQHSDVWCLDCFYEWTETHDQHLWTAGHFREWSAYYCNFYSDVERGELIVLRMAARRGMLIEIQTRHQFTPAEIQSAQRKKEMMDVKKEKSKQRRKLTIEQTHHTAFQVAIPSILLHNARLQQCEPQRTDYIVASLLQNEILQDAVRV